jgi:Zn-dependent peptidase ImmA (M78 family)/transcriptional regulator with XRE-family HTH domain
MDWNILPSLDSRELGRRVQEARRACGKTQQEAADYLGVARTTITAIEKGERRLQPSELSRLAAFYGRSIGELIRPRGPVEPFTVQLRATLAPDTSAEAEIVPYVLEFQRLCEDYAELERVSGAAAVGVRPPVYSIEGIAAEAAAEDVATAERNRLGLGDGPLPNLRQVLDQDVGLRIFFIDLPSWISAMFAYTDDLGGCVAVNRKHPEERRRNSMGHEYGHFLTKRYQPEVRVLKRYQRLPHQERFADAFARSFLMPATGLRRRFHELRRSRETDLKIADLCTLAHFYFVSVQGLILRLEELRLISTGTWARIEGQGFRVREAQKILKLPEHPADEEMFPARYRYLAVTAYLRGDLSEGQLARFLRTDRLDARRIVHEMAEIVDLSDDGELGTVSLDLGESLSVHGA